MKSISKLLIVLNLLACSSYAADDVIKITGEQINNLGIKLAQLQASHQIPLLYAPAKVVVPPTQEYIVSASQAGLINKLNASTGDRVTKNQVLAHINSPALLTLQRQYLKAGSERRLARAEFERDKKLFTEGVISDRRWQETRTRYLGFVAENNEARQLLEIAGMSDQDIQRLVSTRRLSSQLSLYAPIDGVILERMAVAGERIDILAPIYRIANLEQLWLEINIPQEKMAGIKVGDQVIIENTSVKAGISLLGQSVDPINQTILARAVIAGPQSEVRVGQTVNTQIIQISDQPVFKVANAAIAQNEGKYYIFLRQQQGFSVISVTILGKQGKESIITGNLQGNEEIAISGAVALKANWLGLGEDE